MKIDFLVPHFKRKMNENFVSFMTDVEIDILSDIFTPFWKNIFFCTRNRSPKGRQLRNKLILKFIFKAFWDFFFLFLDRKVQQLFTVYIYYYINLCLEGTFSCYVTFVMSTCSFFYSTQNVSSVQHNYSSCETNDGVLWIVHVNSLWQSEFQLDLFAITSLLIMSHRIESNLINQNWYLQKWYKFDNHANVRESNWISHKCASQRILLDYCLIHMSST